MINLFKKTLIAFLLIFLIYSLSHNIFEYKKKLALYMDYKKDYQEALEKNKKLKTEVLKSQDYYFLEKNIRQKLNLLQPNEIAIILPKLTLTPSHAPKIEKPVYQKWLELFFPVLKNSSP